MWSSVWKGGRRVVGVVIGVFAAAAGIVEGADKIWPRYFEDRETQEFRDSVRSNLGRLNETTATNGILLNEILVKIGGGTPPQASKIGHFPVVSHGFFARASLQFSLPRQPLHLAQARAVSQEAEAVSGKTGLIGGRTVDGREACLPAVSSIAYSNLRISEVSAEGAAGREVPFDEAPSISAEDFERLTSGRAQDKRALIKEFDSGCYAARLTRNDTRQTCVVAVAISSGNLGRGSVRAIKCRIEADY